MRLRNNTPLDALAWAAEGVDGNESHVVAVKAGYRIEGGGGEPHRLVEREGPSAARLVIEDRYFGEVHRSGVREESDLVPFKPRCDVLVNAVSFAPGGEPLPRWSAEIRVIANTGEVLLAKAISVLGPRWFERSKGAWSLSEPEPARSVPVRWDLAYGGTSLVPDALHEACLTNPLGRGWVEARWIEALVKAGEVIPDRLPAPQIEAPDRPILALDMTRQEGIGDARSMAAAARAYAHTPVGLGAVGRAWTPRLQRAGTYDDTWKEERWPHLPRDFDHAHWNAAPTDQQIESLPPGARIELHNLVDPARAEGGVVRVDLPRARPSILAYRTGEEGTWIDLEMDTVIIDVLDAEALHIDLVWRASVPRAEGFSFAELSVAPAQEGPLRGAAFNAFRRGER